MSLRVLHISPYSPATWAYGGIPRVVGELTAGLAERGHRVTLFATDVLDDRSRLTECSPEGVRGTASPGSVEWRIFRNVSNRAAYHLQAFTPLGFADAIRRAASSFDVGHIHACHNVLGIVAARELMRAGVPYVLQPNGTAPVFERRKLAKRMLGWLGGDKVAARASRLLAVSAAEASQLRRLGVADCSLRVVSNPIALNEFDQPLGGGRFRRRLGIGAAPMVLSLARITPRKEVATLVEAFARVQSEEAHLVLAGNDLGGLRGALSRAEDLNLSQRVHVTGLLRGVDRLHAMADATVVSYATSGEVFGLVPVEALLTGTPVIVGDDGGCAEVIRAVGGGLTVAPGDPEALSDALMRTLKSPDQWGRRAVAAARRVRERYATQVIAERLESEYLDVLGYARESLTA